MCREKVTDHYARPESATVSKTCAQPLSNSFVSIDGIRLEIRQVATCSIIIAKLPRLFAIPGCAYNRLRVFQQWDVRHVFGLHIAIQAIVTIITLVIVLIIHAFIITSLNEVLASKEWHRINNVHAENRWKSETNFKVINGSNII